MGPKQQLLMLRESLANPTPTVDIIDHTDWTRIRKLGNGAYGTVFLALNKRDGSLFAVKECNIGANPKQTGQLEAEIKTLSKLKHENIVKYYGAMTTPEGFF